MAISVDTVYRKVLAILNKESRGFLTPDEFNKIGSQVQLDLLDKAFHDYNRAVARESMGRGGQGYADISKKIQDRIDPFYTTSSVTLTSGSGSLPTVTVDSYTRSNVYNMVRVYSEDSCLNPSTFTELDRIEKSKLSYLLSSPLTAPSTTFPVYYITGSNINVRPIAISSIGIDYIAIPSDPNWTYTTDTFGSFTYSNTASGHADFELHSSEESTLVARILQLAGITLKDNNLLQIGGAEEGKIIQQQKQ